MFRLIVFSLFLAGELCAQIVDNAVLLNTTSYDAARLPILKTENAKLERQKATLFSECGKNIDYWSKVYNDTYNSLKHDLPDVMELEKNLSGALAEEAALDRSVQETGVYLELLKLKKHTLISTIDLLNKHESHKQACIDHTNYIGFKHIVEETKPPTLSARSRSMDRRGSQENIQTYVIRQTQLNQNLQKERDNILMTIEVQQESFKNQELLTCIVRHTSFCEKKIADLKTLIETLKKWPQAVTLEPDILDEVRKVNDSIAKKRYDLINAQDQLEALVTELRELHAKYDSRRDVEECVTRLNRWPLDEAVGSIKYKIQGALNFRPNMIENRYHLAIEDIIDTHNNSKKSGYLSSNNFKERRVQLFKIDEYNDDYTLEDKALEEALARDDTFWSGNSGNNPKNFHQLAFTKGGSADGSIEDNVVAKHQSH